METTVYTSVQKFRKVVEEAGWSIPNKVWDQVSSSTSEKAEEFDYGWDDRPIYYFIFITAEEYDDQKGCLVGEHTLLRVKRGVWSDLEEDESTMACGGCLLDTFWIKPSGCIGNKAGETDIIVKEKKDEIELCD